MTRAQIEKMLLREAELGATDQRTSNQAARVVLSIKAARTSSAAPHDEARVASPPSRTGKEAAATSLLPWRNATVGRYRRIF